MLRTEHQTCRAEAIPLSTKGKLKNTSTRHPALELFCILQHELGTHSNDHVMHYCPVGRHEGKPQRDQGSRPHYQEVLEGGVNTGFSLKQVLRV